MSDVMQILASIEQGDPTAADRLLPLVYDELRRLAAAKLAGERPGQTLQATALVHEAYLRLLGRDTSRPWQSRSHFFAAAAEAMRRILIERARHKRSLRAGGARARVELVPDDCVAPGPHHDVLDVADALQALAAHDARAAELVKLRYFAGLTMAAASQVLGVSIATAENDWTYAKCWLKLRLAEEGPERRDGAT